MLPSFPLLVLVVSCLAAAVTGRAQFRDDFNGPKLEGWWHETGDGTPTMTVEPSDGFLRINVDGTTDHHGVWWSFIKRDITAQLDLAKLQDPDYELRVEARVRGSHAPRRVNFMINTQRTTDFHEHLREFELSNNTDWHTISMTTRDFDPAPGDTVFVQFCVTDWGPDQYSVDVDYYRADVVRRAEAGPDKGEPLVYHPPIPDPKTFAHHVGVTHDSVINSDFPDVNFNDWHAAESTGQTRILTIDSHQWAILRWNLDDLRGRQATGAGILELVTCFLPTGGKYIEGMGRDLGEEFGKIHVVEILGGEPAWDQATVTYRSLLQGRDYADVFNTQMIIDLELAAEPGGKAYFTLPRPAMQRLLDGRTKGILLRPLGAVPASIYASEDARGNGPTIHFSTVEP